MNKTTKILLIVGGIIGIVFLTKKYWYKPKPISVPKEPNSDGGIGNNPLPINTKPMNTGIGGVLQTIPKYKK